ncbi:MAG: M14-type cytosolic carboxypeptidase [Proteobacteria bacterium]|nr:M14-type cytosolic carboxypeptidase [Pseudomonadota bacterium]MDA0896155.1 M14-type cytosolic carboxypeptidase [Pseudomonadota bacterium]MDA1244737.1 M14-type cytosolic carboxypeptidase [Pseudomonadota bacterium]
MSTSKRISLVGMLLNSRISWRSLRRLLKAAVATIALSSGSVMADFCESDSALIDDNFSGGNLGVCEFTSSNSVSFTITPEDAPPINPSAWYSFRVSPKREEPIQLILTFVDGHARYWPKISSDGETWRRLDESQVDISDDRSRMTIALARSRAPLFVSAQELLVNDDYERWMHSLAEHPELMSRTLGRSIQGRPIQALITAPKSEVVYFLGRQHPPEITGGLAMQSFIDEVFSESDLADEFRARFMLVLVPLINPDGVAAGHWRHNMGGRDLNRDWGPFTQPEIQSVKRLIDELDDAGIAPKLMLDFHSTQRSRFYTQMPEDFDEELDFARDWLGRARLRVPDFDFLYDPRKPSGQENTKNYFYATYHIPAITYEIGDEVDRTELDRTSPIFAQEMMRVMLARD